MKPFSFVEEQTYWSSTWRTVSTFVDRVLEARTQDADRERWCDGLFRAAWVSEKVRARKASSNDHFLLPPQRGPRRNKILSLSVSTGTLPGLVEQEFAVLPLSFPADDFKDAVKDGDIDKLAEIAIVSFPASRLIFTLEDGEILYAPHYSMGRLLSPTFATVKPAKGEAELSWFWSFYQRNAAALVGIDVGMGNKEKSALQQTNKKIKDRSIAPTPATWKQLCDHRRQNSETVADYLKLIAEDEVDLLSDALVLLADGEGRTPQVVADARAVIQSTLKNTAGTQITKLSKDYDKKVEAAILELNEQRIAYPSGSLRQLRTLEIGLSQLWASLAPMLEQRRKWVTQPRATEVLDSFWKPTYGLMSNGGPAKLAKNSTWKLLKLAAGSLATQGAAQVKVYHQSPTFANRALEDLEALRVGIIAGSRPSLAIVTAADRDGAAEKLRLSLVPLRVSLASGKTLAGIAGMCDPQAPFAPTLAMKTEKGTIPAKELVPTSEEFCKGRYNRPDLAPAQGLIEGTVALWSRLCLIFGRKVVGELPGGTQSSRLRATDRLTVFGGEPTLGTAEQKALALQVSPGCQRLILDATTLPARLFEDGDRRKPLLARPGEWLCLEGLVQEEEESDRLHKVVTAVEVIAVSAATAEEVLSEKLVHPLRICPPTVNRLVMIVRGVRMENPITQAELHADFSGFGGASLAAGALLPPEVEPSLAPTTKNTKKKGAAAILKQIVQIDRAPELELARMSLDMLLGRSA